MTRSTRTLAAALSALLVGSVASPAVWAQTPAVAAPIGPASAATAAPPAAPLSLPPPASTDPVALQLMHGFPPPPDKRVNLGNLLQYPNARWGFHHLRALGPTAPIHRSTGRVSSLPSSLKLLDNLSVGRDEGQALTLLDWQRKTYTDALLVLHRGKVVYERYDAGMTPQSTHVLWSMSKSLTGLVATQLIHEGRLDPTALVSHYLPELKDSAWGDATVQQTLDMTTSASYSEDFRRRDSGIFQYLMAGGLVPSTDGVASGAGARGVLDWLPTVKKDGEHGRAFSYKTVDTEVVGWMLQRVTGQSLPDLLSTRLWAPLGMEQDGEVWLDPVGTPLASVGVGATARDLARLGEMLRRQGQFQGRQVVASAVVDELRKGADPERFKAAGQTARAGYSYHNAWWIPHDRDGTFEAKGLNGQHLHINPRAALVVVKLSSHPVPNTVFTHALDRQVFAALATALQSR